MKGGEGVTEDETVGWHQRLNGHEFEQAPGDGEGRGSLAHCSPCGCNEDTTERLNNTPKSSTHPFLPKDGSSILKDANLHPCLHRRRFTHVLLLTGNMRTNEAKRNELLSYGNKREDSF